MREVLEFIFNDIYNFLGTVVLLHLIANCLSSICFVKHIHNYYNEKEESNDE